MPHSTAFVFAGGFEVDQIRFSNCQNVVNEYDHCKIEVCAHGSGRVNVNGHVSAPNVHANDGSGLSCRSF